MSEAFDPTFTEEVPLLNNKGLIKQKVTLECVGYKKNMVDSLVTRKDIKETALGFAITSTQPEFVAENGVLMLGKLPLSYEVDNPAPGIHIWKDGNKFKMKSSLGLRSLAMTELRAVRESGQTPADSLYDVVMPDSIITLEMAKLYNVQGQQFVLAEIRKNTGRRLIKSSVKDAAPDYLFVRLRSKGQKSEIVQKDKDEAARAARLLVVEGGFARLFHRLTSRNISTPNPLPIRQRIQTCWAACSEVICGVKCRKRDMASGGRVLYRGPRYVERSESND